LGAGSLQHRQKPENGTGSSSYFLSIFRRYVSVIFCAISALSIGI